MPSLRDLTSKAHKYMAFSPNPEADPSNQDGTGIGLGQPDRTPRIPSTPRQQTSRNFSQSQSSTTGASASSTVAAAGLTPSDSYGRSTGTSPNIGSGGDTSSRSLRARITTPLMNDYERGNASEDESTEDEGDTGKWKGNVKGKGYRMSGNERMLYPSRTSAGATSSPGGPIGGAVKPERAAAFDARGYPQKVQAKAKPGLGVVGGGSYAPSRDGTRLFDADIGARDGRSSRASYASSAPSYITHDATSVTPTSATHMYPPISVQAQDLGLSHDRTPSIWSGVTQHSPTPSWTSETGFGVKDNWGQGPKYGQAEGLRPALLSRVSSEDRLGEALMTSHFAGAGGASLGRKHQDDFGQYPDENMSFATFGSKLAMGRETNTRSLSALDGPYALPLDMSELANDGPDDDDYLHELAGEERPGKRSQTVAGHVAYLFSPRGLGNLGCMALLVLGLVTLFAGYPIISSQVDKHTTTWLGSYNIGGVNGSGQVPDVIGHFGLIDPDTPQDAYTHTSFETGASWNLVFSDEFNTDGRTFYDGDDPYWTAEDYHYHVTNNLEWYDPKALTTENGYLKITLSKERNHGLNYTGGLMTTWNKFCFTGGCKSITCRSCKLSLSLRPSSETDLVASVSLPGTSDVYGLWPALWTLGNLGRAGYAGTTDGLWPYSYNQVRGKEPAIFRSVLADNCNGQCDVGTLRNQSLNGE